MKDLERAEELKHIKQLLMIQADFYNYEYEQISHKEGEFKVTPESEHIRKKLRAANQAIQDIEFLIRMEEY